MHLTFSPLKLLDFSYQYVPYLFELLGNPTVAAERGWAGQRGTRLPGKGCPGDVGLGMRGRWRGVMGRDSGGGAG